PCAHVGRKGADRRIRATQLERARRLQGLRLHQQAGICAGERDQRGPDGDPGEARGRVPDFIDRYQRRHWPTLWPVAYPARMSKGYLTKERIPEIEADHVSASGRRSAGVRNEGEKGERRGREQ